MLPIFFIFFDDYLGDMHETRGYPLEGWFHFPELLPMFHNVRLSSITYIHIDVNESKHIYLSRFINIYINVGNTRKFYIIKRKK